MNYARRQQFRRRSPADQLMLTGIAAAVLGMLLMSTGFALPGEVLFGAAVVVAFRGTPLAFPRRAQPRWEQPLDLR